MPREKEKKKKKPKTKPKTPSSQPEPEMAEGGESPVSKKKRMEEEVDEEEVTSINQNYGHLKPPSIRRMLQIRKVTGKIN